MKRFLAVAFLLVLAGCASSGGGSMSSSMTSSGMSTSAMAGSGRSVVAPGNYNTNGSWSPGSDLPDVRF